MKPKRRPASVKAPRVRWARAHPCYPYSRVCVGSYCVGQYVTSESASAAVKSINRELSRLVAARDKRRERKSSAFERDLTSILDSEPTRKLVKSEAKRRNRK